MKNESYQILEQKYAEFGNKKFGVAVNTGTAALHLALVALGIKPGDEVIVPDFTFASVAFAVTYCGATPVFVDVDEKYNLDVEQVGNAINPNTKAIIIAHTYGRKANTAALKRFQLPIIEDLCEAQGVLPENDTTAVYSLYRNKILPAELPPRASSYFRRMTRLAATMSIRLSNDVSARFACEFVIL